MSVDLTVKRKKISYFLCCAVMSEIVLFYGKEGLTQRRFDERWTYDPYPPSLDMALRNVRVGQMKWYINQFMQIDDEIWNGSFTRGLTACGNIKWNVNKFPSFRWTANKKLLCILQNSPFYGKIKKSSRKRYGWNHALSLYLKCDESSISFMAGVLATGQIKEHKNAIYAEYNGLVYPYLKKFGIPIEYSSPGHRYNFISPLWPALFSRHMPSEGENWLNIRDGFSAEKYAPILWRMYVSNDIKKNGLPYLKSRRWVYNHYGTKEQTERQWLELGLTQLDNRIKKIVQEWAKLYNIEN